MSDLRGKLQRAAERATGFMVEHVEICSVAETFQGVTVWAGMVDVFEVTGNEGVRVYAWAVENERYGTQYIAVVEEPPIDSALSAVRSWLVDQAKRGDHK